MANTTIADGTDPGAVSIEGEQLFELLGRAHTMGILKQVVIDEREVFRFGELQEALDIAPNTLSRRLEELVELGLLERTQYDEIPPRVEYEPTTMLDDLEPAFREIDAWLDAYSSRSLDCPE
ncbi:winged helix-turn-helix transcriptional regulator [Halocatena halophila]|uniref:winged helix-turn-helix transcriptional regulator n=1 Tax=Halocatena halophila TaxID=2814576 RepID=UPI002ED18AB7